MFEQEMLWENLMISSHLRQRGLTLRLILEKQL